MTPIIDIQQLRNLAVWFAAGYQYRLIWDDAKWRFTLDDGVQLNKRQRS